MGLDLTGCDRPSGFRRERPCEGFAPDDHRPVDDRHAGAFIGAAVDLDEAILAHAHAAEYAALGAAARRPEAANAMGGERGGEALAVPRLQSPAFEFDLDHHGVCS